MLVRRELSDSVCSVVVYVHVGSSTSIPLAVCKTDGA